jgi:hypothetical protein
VYASPAALPRTDATAVSALRSESADAFWARSSASAAKKNLFSRVEDDEVEGPKETNRLAWTRHIFVLYDKFP